MKGAKMFAILGSLMLLVGMAAYATAGGDDPELRCRAESRGDPLFRSKASVDGKNLPAGTYTAEVTCPDGTVVPNDDPMTLTAQDIIDGNDEVGFDFDSNLEVAEGGEPADTPIPATCVGAGFTAQILVTGGDALEGGCEVRVR